MTRAAAWAVVAIASSGACGFKASNASSDAAVDTSADGSPDAPPVHVPPTLTPESHNFGSWLHSSPVLSTTFAVSSTSPTGALAVSITGTDAGVFVLGATTCQGVALPANSSCSITVSFQPDLTPYTPKSGTLQVVESGGVTLSSSLVGRHELLGDLATQGPYDFGVVHVGQPSAAHTYTVFYSGTIQTGPLSLNKAGSDPTAFTVQSDTCTGTQLQQSMCTIDVVFAPNTVGAKSAYIDVIAAPGGNATVSVMGTGQALTITPAPADFGSVALTTTSTPQTLTVTNVAAAAVGPLVTARAGNHPNDFALANDTCNGATLAPLATCTLDVTFAPALVGNRNGLVRLTVGGTIIADGIVQGVGIPLDPLTISPTSYMFTATTSGQTSAVETFTLFNTGLTTSGTIASALSGTDLTQFAIVTATDTCTGLTVPAGGMCTIDVTFTPTSTGPKTATLTLSTTTPGATASATLTGTGF